MRAEIEKWKTEANTKAQALAANEAKIKELEARGKDVEAMIERSKQLEKERDDARAELRRARKEVDPEFSKKWQEPFEQAVFDAEDLIGSMDVTDPVSGEVRRGTKEDVTYLYNIENPSRRNNEIRKMFGDDAITVIPKVDQMRSINSAYRRALAVERTKAAELEKQEQGQRLQSEAQLRDTYSKVVKDLAESVEEYRDAPDDKEAAELRQKGYEIFDAQPPNAQQAIMKRAHVRHIVAAWAPMKLQMARLKAELDALKAEKAKEKESDPNTPTRRSGGTPEGSSALSWEEAARKELV